MSKPKLTIELVPATSWFENVRSALKPSQWDRLRKATYARAGYRCEVCGGAGSKHPVECHELWEFNADTHVQKLTGLIALCPACHEVKHIGFAEQRGRLDNAAAHLMRVNGWNETQAVDYIAQAFMLWERRSSLTWQVDIEWAKQAVKNPLLLAR